MPFSPESMLRAETLDHITLELTDDKLIAEWQYFGKRAETLDPIIEAFRARRSHWEKTPEHDIHIVIEHRDDDIFLPNGRVRRTYGFSYCPYNRNSDKIPPIQLYTEYEALLHVIFTELITLFDEWHDEEDGMYRFLEEQNKSVMDNFLYKYGYKDVAKTKEQRRKEFFALHPEFKKPHTGTRKKT